jgi:hypothetical protein
MPKRYCAMPARCSAAKELRERLRELEALLRDLDPEEGHEWPCGECEQEGVAAEHT